MRHEIVGNFALPLAFCQMEWCLAAGLDCAVMQRAPGVSEALQLLRGYLCTLEKHPLNGSVEAREIIRRHIFDLVLLAITPHGPLGQTSMSAVVAARLAAIVDYITD
ncbi:hypothetical protein NKI95_26915 [Mesorhizobium sp. M0306]|uniref:hypothetical protein n=1 Tax=unclassified Mesorhizobium TaxID=325217 RepID=UPI00333CA2AF